MNCNDRLIRPLRGLTMTVLLLLLFVSPAVFADGASVAHVAAASSAQSDPSAPAQSEPIEMAHHLAMSEYDFPGLAKKISLDIRSMDVIQFLKFLASEGSLNIVTSKNVTGSVNLLINDVTISDALEITLAMNNLASEVKGNIISVMTNAEYKTLYGVDFYDQRKTFVYQLKYASVKNVGAMLANIKSDIGKIIFDDSTGTMVLIDTPSKIKEMREIIKQQELPTVTRVYPTQTRVFELKYAKVEALKDDITKLLTPDIGTVRADTRTNSFIVTDMPGQFKKIEVVLGAFDRKTRQVFIEAKIVEVTLGDKFQWGIDWQKVIRMSFANGVKLIPAVAFPLSGVTALGTLTVQTINSTDANVLIQMLATVTDTRILSNPHLTVEEGKEAKIEVIEKQPYEEDTTTTASGGTTTASKSYQWVNIGVSLNVTARINSDGYINMLIKPEASSISAWYGGVAQAAGSVPVVKSSNAQTTVSIKDGTTIIIAGMVKDNKTKSVEKVPFFGDLPLGIGKAFRQESDEIVRTETIVFITPRIVSGDKTFLLEKDNPKPIKGVRE